MKTPAEDRVKKTDPFSRQVDSSKWSSEEDFTGGSSKEARRVFPSGKTPHNINPVIL
jgi:hypothetical protein